MVTTQAAVTRGKRLPPSATGPEEETARLTQALEDLSACGAGSVSLVHCPSASRERSLVRELTSTARDCGFVTAEVSLREHGLETPEDLVREILHKLTPPGETRPRGLLWMLDDYFENQGETSARLFTKEANRVDAHGDLSALCRAYLATGEDATAEVRAFEAWCDGTEPPRKYRNRSVRRALSERTAQRSLGELTRIIRALGYYGTLIVLSEGDAVAAQTERRREKAYTLIRELVDNFDGAGGALATRVIITGQDALFEGEESLQSLAPLKMRLEVPSNAEPPPPHRSWTTLVKQLSERRHRKLEEPPERRMGALRNLIRISEGLPPTSRVTQMSVGQERLDRNIRKLFNLVKRSGSFFSVLVGEYGSGKTHLMMHMAQRALEDQRPVFWLNLERTNLDLGNPARHLSRFLEHSQFPMRGRPNATTLAARWTRTTAATEELVHALEQVAQGDNEEAVFAAKKALRIAEGAKDPGHALENFLVGADLENRPGDPTYRRDAYRRIYLWFALLAQKEDIRGPVILIDEAENLYTSGRPPASRRTALRSLAFYCGGALPGTCVILGLTPPAYEELKSEARDLLAEADSLDTTLDLEDVARFRKSLWGLKPTPVKALTRPERSELCERVRRMHRAVRGKLEIPDWHERVHDLVKEHESPRTLIRALIDELDSRWWSGK